MEAPRVLLLVVLIIFLFLTPESQLLSAEQHHKLIDAIDREHHAVRVLNASSYGELDPQNGKWINVTGLREEDAYAWDLLQPVKDAALTQLSGLTGVLGLRKLDGGLDSAPSNQTRDPNGISSATRGASDNIPLYRNVTGLIRGKWARSEISRDRPAPRPNLTALAPDAGYVTYGYGRNITGSTGEVQIKLNEKTSDMLVDGGSTVREISATMTIKDEKSSVDSWDATLHGVHFPDFGGIILTTTSEK